MKRKWKITAVSAAAWLLAAVPAFADNGTAIEIHADRVQNQEVDVTCTMAGAEALTNGKLRITYDPSALTLKQSSLGEALDGVTATVNDPVSGNKQEGEIVLVFAAGQETDMNGTLLDMVFEPSASYQDGDGAFNVNVEELAADGQEVSAGTDVVTEGETGPEQSGGGSESTETNGPEQTVQGGGAAEGEKAPQNSSGASDKKTGEKDAGGKKAGIVKTGDETPAAGTAAVFGGAVVLAGVLAAVRVRAKGRF